MSTYNLALAYRAAGKIDEAIVGFERTQQLDPRSGRAHFQLGDIYMQRGQPAKALEVLNQGLALDVDRPPFLVKLGEAYLELKRYDEAEKVLRRRSGCVPTSPAGSTTWRWSTSSAATSLPPARPTRPRRRRIPATTAPSSTSASCC